MSIVVVALLLVMALTSDLNAGTEERCTSLGSQCLGGEPMNTSTMWGGTSLFSNPDPSFGSFINFDDSPSTTQLYPSGTNPNLSGGWESYCEQFRGSATAASEAAFLPSLHTLSYVLRQQGDGGLCHVGSIGTINEAPDMTYCIRHYRRWDANSHVPQNAGEQQKIMTISGYKPGPGGPQDGDSPNGYITIQISMTTSGQIHTRFDGNFWRSDGGQQNGMPDIGNMSQCQGNYCRFEACMDVSATGVGQGRYRMTPVTPGNNVSTSHTSQPGTNLHPEGVLTESVGGGGDAMYAQCVNPITNVQQPCVSGPGSGGPTFISYNSHFIVTRVRPTNSAFWPGPACEVEGGCGGVIPQTPGTPILNVTWAW